MLGDEVERYLADRQPPRAPRRRRLAAVLTRRALDARLLAGANALSDPLLAARAAQLTRARARRRTAAAARKLVEQPLHPGARMFRAPFVAGAELLALADRLGDDAAVHERGVLLAREVVAGRRVRPDDAAAFRAAVAEALAALSDVTASVVDPGGPPRRPAQRGRPRVLRR